MEQYLDLLKEIKTRGTKKDDRTGTGTISIFGHQMRFNLQDGFPLVTTKKVNFNSILHELLWFVKGDTNIKYLVENKVNIWNEWPFQNWLEETNQSKDLEMHSEEWKEKLSEFIDLIRTDNNFAEQFGDLGPVYGFQWRHFGAQYINKDCSYFKLGIDQLQNVIDLIKNDPTSRRIILSAWNPCDLDKMALPPCHVMIQFSIDKGFIDAQMYQRSGDMFLGVPFNIASYALLMHIIGSITGYTPRYFHHLLGDAHIYMNHIDAIREQIFRIPNEFPKLTLTEQITDINSINENIFKLENYNHYPTIKAEMIA